MKKLNMILNFSILCFQRIDLLLLERMDVAWFLDGVSWNLENFSGYVDPYLAITEQILPNANGEWDRRWVAVGGEHRFFASMSEDGGTSWTNITFSTCLGDQLQSLAWFEDAQLFLAQGSSTCHHNMIHSTNGLLWNPLIQTHPFDRYQIRTMDGTTYLFRQLEDGGKLYTSTNGQNFQNIPYPFPPINTFNLWHFLLGRRSHYDPSNDNMANYNVLVLRNHLRKELCGKDEAQDPQNNEDTGPEEIIEEEERYRNRRTFVITACASDIETKSRRGTVLPPLEIQYTIKSKYTIPALFR